jgi:hypothetical protein
VVALLNDRMYVITDIYIKEKEKLALSAITPVPSSNT